MAIRLIGTFYDINGAEHKVDIYDTDFVGSDTSFDVKYCTINYQGDGEDINAAMVGSRASIGMSIPTTDTTLNTFITDLTTGEEGRFWVEVTKVLTSLVVWRGIITPDFSGEQDTAPYFEFKLSAVCGLATLKKTPYHDGTALYEGTERFTTHIVTALTKLSHESMWGGSDVFIKTAIDWWEASMSSGATDDALYQGGVEHSAFYKYGTAGDVDNDVISCYDVIRQILEGFNARILQVEGVWWIEQIPYRSTSPYYTRHYSKSGTYLSNATNSGANVIGQTKTGAKLATIEYDYLPALRKVEIYYNTRSRRNFLAWWTPTLPQFNQKIKSNGGEAILRLKFGINWTVADALAGAPGITGYFLMARFTLKVGSYYLKRGYSVANFSYYVDQPTWENSLQYFYVPINVGAPPTDGTPVSGTVTVELITPPLPADGSSNTFDYLANNADYVDWFGDLAGLDWFATTLQVFDPYLEVYEEGAPVVGEDKGLYAVTNPNTASEVYEKDIFIANAPVLNGAGAIQRWNGSDWVDSGLWGQGVETRNQHLPTLIAKNIMNARLTPLKRMNGQLLGNFRIHRLIQTSYGEKWMMQDATWDVSRNTISGTWFNLDYGTAGVSASPVKIKVNHPGTEPTTDPAPPNGGITTNSPGLNINPAPTVLKPVAFNAITAKIAKAATVTSITLEEAATGTEFLAGDGVTVVNPVTGQFQTFEVSVAPGTGDTSISVTSEVADYEFPVGSYLVVKQNAYSFRLPQGTAEGQILRWDDTDEVWEVYSGSTDGHVLTWDTTNGWQAEANPAGVSDGDKGDITVSAGGTTWTIDDGVVSNAKLRDSAGTSVIGRSVGTTGDPGDIIAASDGQVLRRAGGVLGFGQVDVDGIADGAVSLAKIQNINTDRLIGRDTAGTAAPEEISLNATLEFTGSGGIQRAALTGDVTAAAGNNATTIANNAVTTGKIADGAVTYAKLQNVSTNNRVLGRITAGAGNAEELTNINLYSILGMTGTPNHFALWTGANTLSSDAAFTFDAANDRMTITGTVAGTGANNAFLNLNSGAIAGKTEFLRMSGNITNGLAAGMYNANNAAAAASSVYTLQTGGANGGDPFIQFIVASASNDWSIGTDNSDGDKFKITPKSTAPGSVANSGLIIRSEAAARVGINKDNPAHALDVEGIVQAHQFRNHTNAWAAGNVVFGTGAGTGPVLNEIVGGVNGLRIRFTTGTTPTNNGDILTATYPTSFGGESYVTMSGRTTVAYNDERAKFYISAAGANSFTLKANGTLTASKEYHIQFTIFGITLG